MKQEQSPPAMEEASDSIVEARDELLVSRSGGDPTFRTAHFIKPSLGSKYETCTNQKAQPSYPASFDPKSWPLKVKFNGWRYPSKKWESWAGKMASLHEPTWKQAGIYKAIRNSRYRIMRNDDVVLGLAQKWCDETKSFIFSWGEATITLEDVLVLGGFSVLGSPVFAPLVSEELKEIQGKLETARKELNKSTAKKACQFPWMLKFMDSGSEIEHEAFLAMWLSRFVFPSNFDVIVQRVFPIAIHLARGKRIALAPSVLAHIYKELTILKENIVAASKLKRHELDGDEEFLDVTLWSPFQLVQVWCWERFLELRPEPNLIENGEPRLAQWHDLKCRVGNVKDVLDSAKESFDWRPYTRALKNWNAPKFYVEGEICVEVDCLKDELLTLARCMRVSQLVGLDCVVQYLPNRVALQFGLDQDIPGNVTRLNCDPEIAWVDYVRISEWKMYIPPRLSEGDVTVRYLKWWEGPMSKSSEGHVSSGSEKLGSTLDGCPSKRLKKSAGHEPAYVAASLVDLSNDCKDSEVCSGENGKYLEHIHASSLAKIKELNASPFPPGFPPKFNSLDAKVTPGPDKMTIEGLLKLNSGNEKMKNRKLADSDVSRKDQAKVTETLILVDDDDDIAGSMVQDAVENFSSPNQLSSCSRNKCSMKPKQPPLPNEAASGKPFPADLLLKQISLEAKVTTEEENMAVEQVPNSNRKLAGSPKKDETKVTEKAIQVDNGVDEFAASIEGNAGKDFPCPSPGLSATVSCVGCSVNLKQPNVIPVEQHEAAGRKPEIISSEYSRGSVMANKINNNASKLNKQVNTRDEEACCTSRTDLPKLEIEDRIIKLERLVAKIKAAKSCHKVH